MAELNEVENDAGVWLSLRELDGQTLGAFLPPAQPDRAHGLTVYWPARDAPMEFQYFLRQARLRLPIPPNVQDVERRIGFDRLSGDPTELTGSESDFSAFDFVRFEHVFVDATAGERAVLVAWANLIAAEGPNVPQDAAGVQIQIGDFRVLQQPLASLITKTSADRPEFSSVASMLRKMDEYLAARLSSPEVFA
jgi:hypothetical protein